MIKTKLTIKKDCFFINGKLVYSELKNSNSDVHGLLLNARFIQGIFDDKLDICRYNRYGTEFNCEKNTDDLIQMLSKWYQLGLRAFTVGFQGGGPCFTINNYTIENNPYSSDGKIIDLNYLNRMERLIGAADEAGLAVIVSLFYGAQTRFLKDDHAVINAVKSAANWLQEKKFGNVIIEIANEHDVDDFKVHPILYTEDGIVDLIRIAKRESGGIPVGCSGTGGYFSEKIAQESDIIFIHGNGQSRQNFYNLIQKAKKIKPERPIICNEDSQAVSQLPVALKAHISWGYYNNMTKQEPPVYWDVLPGEDTFFAYRMAKGIGIPIEELSFEEQFYLQGLEPHMTYENKRWIRLASLYPEKIDYVDFYRNGEYYATAYDDPFTVNFRCNWLQYAVEGVLPGECWKAEIHLTDGKVIDKTDVVK